MSDLTVSGDGEIPLVTLPEEATPPSDDEDHLVPL